MYITVVLIQHCNKIFKVAKRSISIDSILLEWHILAGVISICWKHNSSITHVKKKN